MHFKKTGCLLLIIFLLLSCNGDKISTTSSSRGNFAVIAYYSGNNTLVDSFAVEKLTHIIFSFGHLRGNKLSIDNAGDSASIHKLVTLKKRNPELKVILSLGGWGGCEFCSPVFSSEAGRNEFSRSVKELLEYFKADGIDLDWEYPGIEGYPGHAWKTGDKPNFTALIKTLRDTFGATYEISFAAGGFDKFLKESVEWDKVMPLLDKVNLMSYDLVSGFSTVTGHHTPLYSTTEQKQSADNAIRYLDSIHVPLNKLIIGAAFYAREWDGVKNTNNGLYQQGRFRSFIPYRRFNDLLSADSGYAVFSDSTAKASYAYNSTLNRFATFDDEVSVRAKTKYAKQKGLGGIMFWELSLDLQSNGLLDAIDKAKNETN